MKVEVALKLFKEKQNLAMLKKEISEILNLLNNLEKSINHLTKQENEFLQKSYIEFLNLGENSLLELSLNFTKARYLFIKKFFENNISSFYKNFVFKEKIILNENKFEGFENLTPKDILKNDDLNAVSLYLFIENIAVKYEKTVNDRDLKDEFKQKLINLYDSVYRIFKALSPNLLEKYFDIVLYNHPMMLVELIKASLSSSYVENVISTFSEENKIFDRLKDDGSFKILDKESLVEFISIIYIKNLNLSSFIYNKSTISILNSTFNEKIETFDTFAAYSKIFINEFNLCPKEITNSSETILCYQLFFKFMLSFSDENLDYNTLFIGSIGVGKSKVAKEILKIKNVPSSNYKILSMHPNYTYEDMVDGYQNGEFVNGEFKALCKEAIKNPDEKYYIILNNIQNCDFEAVFGEICELLDDRYSSQNKSIIRTKNSYIADSLEDKFSVIKFEGNSYFCIPQNLHIIATLNTNYKIPSIVSKFSQIYLKCDYNAILNELKDIKNTQNYIKICQKINEQLFLGVNDEDIELGHFIFINIKNYIKENEITTKDLTNFYEKELKFIIKSLLLNQNLSNLQIKEILLSIKNYLGRI